MIFVGDIAIPGSGIIQEGSAGRVEKLFAGKTVVGNLEGSVCKECSQYKDKRVIYNDRSAFSLLKRWNIKALSLANNHIFDIPGSLAYTKQVLSDEEIAFFGAGENLKEAAEPAIIDDGDHRVTLIGFGWEAIQCPPAKESAAGVNPLRYDYVADSVAKAKKGHPNNKLVVMMHWNYELEYYPQPAERQLARQCIDLGADAVIGGHAHVAQGIEMYKQKPIVYGLGNWAFLQGIYVSEKLIFPGKAELQLAFEWDFKEEPLCHWFTYDRKDQKITWLESEALSSSQRVQSLTPFKDMDHHAYINWFRKHRNKNKLLPIFKNLTSNKATFSKVQFIKIRGYLLDLMLKLNVKKIKND